MKSDTLRAASKPSIFCACARERAAKNARGPNPSLILVQLFYRNSSGQQNRMRAAGRFRGKSHAPLGQFRTHLKCPRFTWLAGLPDQIENDILSQANAQVQEHILNFNGCYSAVPVRVHKYESCPQICE